MTLPRGRTTSLHNRITPRTEEEEEGRRRRSSLIIAKNDVKRHARCEALRRDADADKTEDVAVEPVRGSGADADEREDVAMECAEAAADDDTPADHAVGLVGVTQIPKMLPWRLVTLVLLESRSCSEKEQRG